MILNAIRNFFRLVLRIVTTIILSVLLVAGLYFGEYYGIVPEYAKKANKGLAKKYGIRGYPTALIFDGDGNTVGKTGYRKGGAEGYVKHLMKFRKK